MRLLKILGYHPSRMVTHFHIYYSILSIDILMSVTFLKFNLKSLDVAWLVYQTSLQVCLPQGIKLDYNDLAGESYKKVTEVRVSQAFIRALLRCGIRRESWLEAGSISFDVGMDVYSSPAGWCEAAKAQTNHIAVQDDLTRRARFLYEDSSSRSSTCLCKCYSSLPAI
jgi:BLTP1 N-terminal region